jgi:predicted enzyme related to lactoylglutathione lyase
MDDELISIGQFARLSGLSVHALRHYDDVDRYLTEGITMRVPQTGCRPVQLKITVDDVPKAVEFYREAFGFRYDIARRTEDGDYPAFLFGTYGKDDFFFLIHLLADPDDTDRLGPSTFGLLVDDLDARHTAALAAGGTEVFAAHEPEGMPRCSAVKDPSGNWIWLYQS